jgi:hypothetical protein
MSTDPNRTTLPRLQRFTLSILALGLAAIPATAAFNAAVTPEEIREHIRYLSSEELGGRGSGTEGTRKAAEYIARAFREAGLKPGGERGYFQRFTFNAGVRMGSPNSVVLNLSPQPPPRNGEGEPVSSSSSTSPLPASGRGAGGERLTRRLKLRDDFLPVAFSANGRAAGDCVFVGYGISAPQLGFDEYAGIDVRGKIVVVLRRTPDNDTFGGRFSRFAPLRYKAMTAREKGAAGILFVTGPLTEEREDLGGFRFDAAFADSGIPAAVVKRAYVEEMLRPTGETLSALQTALAHGTVKSMPLPGASATLVCNVVRERRETDNVLGYLEGSDPKLREEVVVIGAHYDHLGMGGEGSRDRSETPQIHPGADDNASGTAGLMELAQHFAAQKPRPRRSLLFIAFSGEELGLLGSAHYVKKPRIPLDRTVAMVNMDMIGRAKGNTLMVLGSGTSPVWKEVLETANRDLQFNLRPTNSGFGNSDHSSFYGKDVPVLFFFTGTHPDYHRPSDTWEKINLAGQTKIVKLVANVVTQIAGLPERPLFVRATGDEPRMAGGGFGVYVGTIPDYSAEGEGVTLSGVREGSPAEKAGLKAGDVIVQFGGKAIKNVYEYTFALRDARAGEPIEVVVLRGGERQTLRVTPERRNRG